jgi:hypothetical protein
MVMWSQLILRVARSVLVGGIGLAHAGQEVSLVGWTVVEKGNSSVRIEPQTVHRGIASLRISRRDWGAAANVSQDINPSDFLGRRIRLAWYTIQKGSTAVVRYRVVNSNGGSSEGVSRASGGVGWAENVSVLDVPEGAVGFTIELSTENPGWACFDDFEIKVVEASYKEPCHISDGLCGEVIGRGLVTVPKVTPEEYGAIIRRYRGVPKQLVDPGFEESAAGSR